jgi:hypothetical protein
MFTRGQQSITEADLNQDLPILFPEDGHDIGPDADLTPAQRATGRFFFIHKSEARQRDDRVRSYEFLHATFGEFLVARLAVTALRDLALPGGHAAWDHGRGRVGRRLPVRGTVVLLPGQPRSYHQLHR